MVQAQVRRVDSDVTPWGVQLVYRRASYIALVGNLVLLAAKGLVAAVSGSSAIYADAANSAADVAYSVLMLVGLRLALQPADSTHPHGHRRFEPLVSLLIGVMMAVAAGEAARTGLVALGSGPQAITSVWAYVVLLFTAAAKAGMYLVVRRMARSTSSLALEATARDNLSDVLTSGAAFVGVAASRLGFPMADPLAALAVSVWIFRSAFEVLSQSVRQLVGGAAPSELTEQVIEAASKVPSVLHVHQVIVEYVGPQVRVDLHINMKSDLHLDQVHEVSDLVCQAIEELADVDHAYVHVEPEGVGG